ncbi:MAG: RagB/SusD family nutrient uptake outer membrane protein [Ignavibacteriae bacterium]|nr:RagB/SusD family nutrient uptake outer membrane protein [Ignavibacteriota bacterium]MCB9214743.1 RagB/SusD family nutrient uptake outer membrane protein [Ignavibacteria bacterium]
MNTSITLKSGLRALFAVTAVLSILLTHVGCSISDDLSVDPNGINDEALKTREGMLGMLVALQAVSGDFYSGDRSRVNSIWAWQMAGTGVGRVQPVRWTNYSLDEEGPTDDNWLNAYRAVKIADDIIRIAPEASFASDDERNTVVGIAQAYKGMVFGELAAMYGSIPVEIIGFDPAQFVSQEEAYSAAQALFDEALANLTAGSPIDQDLNYGGDPALWKAAIHSLKARYFLHVKNYGQALTEANQGIGSASGTLFAIYTDDPNEISNWGHWRRNEGDDDAQAIMVEKSYMDLLKSETGDTRIEEYFDPKGGEFLGYAAHGEASATDAEKDPLQCANLKKYGAFADDFPFISFQEVLLIKAETEARTGSLTNAVTLVNQIRTAAGLADFNSNDQQAVIAEVLKQKSLALFLEGQTYYDMRRTGTLPEATVPVRWIYPFSEKNANPNVPPNSDALVGITLP